MSPAEGSQRASRQAETADTAVSAREHQQRELLDASEDGLLLIDAATGQVIEANQAACRISGYERSGIESSSFDQLFAAGGSEQRVLRDRLAEVLRNGCVQFEWRFVAQRAAPRWLEFRLDRSELTEERVLVLVRDRTEWRTAAADAVGLEQRYRIEAEHDRRIAELEASHAEMEQFTYTVSHDLKSPLVTIHGFVGAVERDLAKGDLSRAGVDLERIRSAATKMAQLLDGLVALSRIGRVINAPHQVSLQQIMHEATELVAGAASARGVRIRVANDLPLVNGDRMRLVQVAQNLLENAIKYLGDQPEPRIEVGMRPDPTSVICWVRDNGIGVQPEYAERIFGLFDKLNPRSEGAGVGLALVRRIVECHGGEIWVESDGKQGSTFVFRLPRLRSQALDASEAAETSGQGDERG
jgi:PAS domain S-box-containing protein